MLEECWSSAGAVLEECWRSAGGVLEQCWSSAARGPHPHTQTRNEASPAGSTVCVFGCGGGSHIHCTGVVACGRVVMTRLKPRRHTYLQNVLASFRVSVFEVPLRPETN